MIRWSIAIVFTAFLVVVSSKFLSDHVLTVNFTKIEDESDDYDEYVEYDFEYKLAAGNTFRGRTFLLHPGSAIHVMIGANGALYWVRIEEYEFANQGTFPKPVRLIERNEDKLYFRDDFTTYTIVISASKLLSANYITEWNLNEICFHNSGDEKQTFKYTISATNNSRKYNGTTLIETYDPHVQRIHLNDDPQLDAVYEVDFSDDEINSGNTFCKSISKHISGEPNPSHISEVILDVDRMGAITSANVNAELLKSLIG